MTGLFEPTGQLAGNLAATSNVFVRIGTQLLGGMLGLGALLHAANSVTRERERDTLDGLLTLPVERAAVLEAKWLGGRFLLFFKPKNACGRIGTGTSSYRINSV